jgi:hypothetical protein
VAWSGWRYRRVFKIRKCQYFNRKCPNWFIQCQYAKVNMIMINEITNCNIYCSQEPSSTNEQSMNNEQKFHDVDLKETKLRILKRYTNLDVIYSITILYIWLTLLRLLVPGHRDLFCTFFLSSLLLNYKQLYRSAIDRVTNTRVVSRRHNSKSNIF